jgi:hypothetical protein
MSVGFDECEVDKKVDMLRWRIDEKKRGPTVLLCGTLKPSCAQLIDEVCVDKINGGVLAYFTTPKSSIRSHINQYHLMTPESGILRLKNVLASGTPALPQSKMQDVVLLLEYI